MHQKSEYEFLNKVLWCSTACGNGISFSTWISNTFLSINSSLERWIEKQILKYSISSFGFVHFVSILTLCCCVVCQILSIIINSTMIPGVKPNKYSCKKYILFLFFFFLIYMCDSIYISRSLWPTIKPLLNLHFTERSCWQ